MPVPDNYIDSLTNEKLTELLQQASPACAQQLADQSYRHEAEIEDVIDTKFIFEHLFSTLLIEIREMGIDLVMPVPELMSYRHYCAVLITLRRELNGTSLIEFLVDIADKTYEEINSILDSVDPDDETLINQVMEWLAGTTMGSNAMILAQDLTPQLVVSNQMFYAHMQAVLSAAASMRSETGPSDAEMDRFNIYLSKHNATYKRFVQGLEMVEMKSSPPAALQDEVMKRAFQKIGAQSGIGSEADISLDGSRHAGQVYHPANYRGRPDMTEAEARAVVSFVFAFTPAGEVDDVLQKMADKYNIGEMGTALLKNFSAVIVPSDTVVPEGVNLS